MSQLIDNKVMALTETAYQFLVKAAAEHDISVQGYLELLISRTEGLKQTYPDSYEAFIENPLVA